MTITSDYNSIDRRQWSDFVRSHPRGTIFQTPEMMGVYAVTRGNKPLVVAAIDGERIVGIVLATVITNGGRLMSLLTKRSIITGGPLVKDDDPAITQELMKAYASAVRKEGAIYSQIRPVYDSSVLTDQLAPLGYSFCGHYNLTLDLTLPYDTLYASLHKERKRNIRQAEESGLVFREVTTPEEIADITRLVELTYKRKGVPLGYSDIFAAAQRSLGASVHFFGAYLDNAMIGGQVRLGYKDLMYAWFAGSDEAYLKKRPNDFLMWNVIRWSKEQGYRLFDFGGGGEPGVPYGVRDYKLKYGCEMFNYGRWEVHHRPITYWAASTAYKLFHKLKGK